MSCENRHALLQLLMVMLQKPKQMKRILVHGELRMSLRYYSMLHWMTCPSSGAVIIHLKLTPLSLSSQSQIKLWRLKLYLKKCLMPLDGIQRSIWMPSGEKQQGETMALFLGPVVGQVVRLPMLSLATSPILFHRGIV